MQKTPKAAFATAALAAAALSIPTATASASQFRGHVCALVTASAARAARIEAPCVEQQQTVPHTTAATWGLRDGAHYLAVRISPAISLVHPVPTLQPRLPRWQGPIRVAPGINASYTESKYQGTANGQGSMRFIAKGNLVTITLADATGAVLPGLTSIAKSIARHM